MRYKMESNEQLIKKYLDLKDRYQLIGEEMEYIKTVLNTSIKDDKVSYDGIGVFARRKEHTRTSFDKNVAKGYLSEEQYNSCIRESKVKGGATIMSWDEYNARSKFIKKGD